VAQSPNYQKKERKKEREKSKSKRENNDMGKKEIGKRLKERRIEE